MLNLVNLLWDLVLDNVLIGVIRDQVSGVMVVIDYQTPAGETFKQALITQSNPGYSVAISRMYEGKMVSDGFHHSTKTGYLCNLIWREFGGNIASLIRFFDNNPEYKEEVLA